MKLVFIMHYHPTTFVTKISAIYDEEKYKLYGLFNSSSQKQLEQRGEDKLFAQTFVQEEYDFEYLTGIIDRIRAENPSLEIAIVTTWEDDVAMCGRLNLHYQLTEENYDRFTNKAIMKQILEKKGVPFPKFMEFDKTEYAANRVRYLAVIEKNISYPMFAKPIDQNGSFDAQPIYNRGQLEDWCEKVSASKNEFQYEIDEFLDEKDWTLFHCDTYIQDGKALYTQICIYNRPCHNFVHGKPIGSMILDPQDPRFARLQAFTEHALIQLGIPKNGMTHMEVFVRGDDFRFLEVANRPPGAWAYKMYEKYLGRNIFVDHIKLQLDPDYKIDIRFGDYSAFTMWPIQKGVVTELKPNTLDSTKEELFRIKVGDEFTPQGLSLLHSACIIVFHHPDLQVVQRDFENIKDTFPFVSVERKEPEQRVVQTMINGSLSNQHQQSVNSVPGQQNQQSTTVVQKKTPCIFV